MMKIIGRVKLHWSPFVIQLVVVASHKLQQRLMMLELVKAPWKEVGMGMTQMKNL